MQIAYICSPYRGQSEEEYRRNGDYARELTKLALRAGLAPITPHLYITQVTDDSVPEERQQGLEAGLALLDGCELVICGNKYGVSSGMQGELAKAEADGKRVLLVIDGDDLETIKKGVQSLWDS